MVDQRLGEIAKKKKQTILRTTKDTKMWRAMIGRDTAHTIRSILGSSVQSFMPVIRASSLISAFDLMTIILISSYSYFH